MKIEKIILAVAAIFLGLLFAGGIFYFFQSTKTVAKPNAKTTPIVSSSPTPAPSVFLVVDKPNDEEVIDSKVLIVSGRTNSNATVTVITDSSQEVITPSTNGDFSTTANIDNGQNIIEIIAIAPNGESVTAKKTVTYSQEEF